MCYSISLATRPGESLLTKLHQSQTEQEHAENQDGVDWPRDTGEQGQESGATLSQENVLVGDKEPHGQRPHPCQPAALVSSERFGEVAQQSVRYYLHQQKIVYM
jgi:hypothetical protein